MRKYVRVGECQAGHMQGSRSQVGYVRAASGINAYGRQNSSRCDTGSRQQFGNGGAVGQACRALRQLTILCKTPNCNPATKAAIRNSLKRPMVRWLCDNGYCTGVTRSQDATKCLNCNGSGVDVVYRNSCRPCNGTGRYSPYGSSATVVCFSFAVEGSIYQWHLPETLVDFVIPSRFQPMSIVGEWRSGFEKTFTDRTAMEIVGGFLEAMRRQKAL